jgi:DNA-binding IscR family transcriptional regulator
MWEELNDKIDSFFENITVADLAQGSGDGGNFVI